MTVNLVLSDSEADLIVQALRTVIYRHCDYGEEPLVQELLDKIEEQAGVEV